LNIGIYMYLRNQLRQRESKFEAWAEESETLPLSKYLATATNIIVLRLQLFRLPVTTGKPTTEMCRRTHGSLTRRPLVVTSKHTN